MEETIEKEVLTTWSIQQFYRRSALINLFAVFFLALPFGFLLIFEFAIGLGGIYLVFEILYGLVILLIALDAIDLIVMSFLRPRVVQASRIKPVGKKETFRRGRRQGIGYILYFHGYGQIRLPNYLYEDFDMGTLSDEELWRCTFPGDKFYLLLSRSGHIIYCFPCNNFEYVGELMPNKYEK